MIHVLFSTQANVTNGILTFQVVDVGSGKGYLSSFLSLQFGLRVYGIDSSSTNTHGAQERNRKLKKFSRAYQKRIKAARTDVEEAAKGKPELREDEAVLCDRRAGSGSVGSSAVEVQPEMIPEAEELFLSALSADVIQASPRRVAPSQLSAEEKERRKRANLERKARSRQDGSGGVFAPLTSHVTADTELRELIAELEVSAR